MLPYRATMITLNPSFSAPPHLSHPPITWLPVNDTQINTRYIAAERETTGCCPRPPQVGLWPPFFPTPPRKNNNNNKPLACFVSLCELCALCLCLPPLSVALLCLCHHPAVVPVVTHWYLCCCEIGGGSFALGLGVVLSKVASPVRRPSTYLLPVYVQEVGGERCTIL